MSSSAIACPICHASAPASAKICPICASPLHVDPLEDSSTNGSGVEPGELTPGVVIDGKYQILEKLGTGGFGDVFRVRHLMLHRELALKTLHAYLAAEKAMRDRFFREARVLMDLMHPNLVTMREVGQWRGLLFMVMDLCPGETLATILEKRKRIPGAEAIRMVLPVLRALDYAHRKGVVHRDLKPANLMLFRDEKWNPDIRILDFGIAKLLDRSEVDEETGAVAATGGMLVGTPQYMSPEQAQGQPIDARTDLYAMGVILYLLVTGKQPFRGANPAEIMKQVLLDPPPPFSRWGVEDDPPGLEAVLYRVLAKSPADRPSSGQELVDGLEALLKKGPETAAPAKPLPAPPKSSSLASESSRVLPLQAPVSPPTRSMLRTDTPPPSPPASAPEPVEPKPAAPSRESSSAVKSTDSGSSSSPLLPTPTTDVRSTTIRVKPPSKPSYAPVAPRTTPVRVSWAPTLFVLALLGVGAAWSMGWLPTIDRLIAPGNGTTPVGPGNLTPPANTVREDPEVRAALDDAERIRRESGPVKRDGEEGSVRREGLSYLGKNPAGREEYLHEKSGVVLVLLPAGQFTMGSPEDEKERDPEERPHVVRISRPFLMGKTEVTNAQYRRFRKGHACQPQFDHDQWPVVGVSWTEANAYCEWAGLRLPTEAEWEYAARGGDGRVFPWGEKWPPPKGAGNFADLSAKKRTDLPAVLEDYDDGCDITTAVGRSTVNPFSLHDVAGNVMEWCSDWMGPYPAVAGADPQGPSIGRDRVLRGGSWGTNNRWALRCARRIGYAPDVSNLKIGFRVCLTP